MVPITGGGAFTRQNIAQINGNFAALTNPDIWIRPQAGSNATADGTYEKPYATMAGAAGSPLFKPGVVIGLLGVLTEEYSSPIVNDITIVGMANQPRQATTNGAANGGGATWLSPSTAAASLLKINGQGWRVENIYFNNSCTTATTGCIELVGGGDPPLTADAGHAQILNCRFTGEANGIYINGGPGFLTIEDNTFMFFDTSGDCAILAGGSGGTGYGSRIADNQFRANLTHIKGLAAAYGWEVTGNHFTYIDAGVTTTSQINFTGGNNNSVYDNHFDVPATTTGLSAMFVLGTNDRWGPNSLGTAVATTLFAWGGPTT